MKHSRGSENFGKIARFSNFPTPDDVAPSTSQIDPRPSTNQSTSLKSTVTYEEENLKHYLYIIITLLNKVKSFICMQGKLSIHKL